MLDMRYIDMLTLLKLSFAPPYEWPLINVLSEHEASETSI